MLAIQLLVFLTSFTNDYYFLCVSAIVYVGSVIGHPRNHFKLLVKHNIYVKKVESKISKNRSMKIHNY